MFKLLTFQGRENKPLLPHHLRCRSNIIPGSVPAKPMHVSDAQHTGGTIKTFPQLCWCFSFCLGRSKGPFPSRLGVYSPLASVWSQPLPLRNGFILTVIVSLLSHLQQGTEMPYMQHASQTHVKIKQWIYKRNSQCCLCEGWEAHFLYINRAPWLCHQQQKGLLSASVICWAHQVLSGMWSSSLPTVQDT